MIHIFPRTGCCAQGSDLAETHQFAFGCLCNESASLTGPDKLVDCADKFLGYDNMGSFCHESAVPL